MAYSSGKVAGALIFIAASQFVLGLIVAEALYSGYSVSENYISDLGVGPSSMIFNSSVFLLGLLLIIGTYFLQRVFHFKALTVLLFLTATGAMGVGVFTENSGKIHSIVSLIAFLFGGLSAIFSFKLVRKPFSAVAFVLGLISLGALLLYGSHSYLGLGPGGMERMIVYPLLMWGAGFGGALITYSEKQTTRAETAVMPTYARLSHANQKAAAQHLYHLAACKRLKVLLRWGYFERSLQDRTIPIADSTKANPIKTAKSIQRLQAPVAPISSCLTASFA